MEMETNVTTAVSEENEVLKKHDSSEGNDVEAQHKCQLCKQSFVERQTLDEHVEQCDLFNESKDKRSTHQNLKSLAKSCSNEMHDESSGEKDRKSRNGKGFYEVIFKENIRVKCTKDYCNKQNKGANLEKEDDVIPNTDKLNWKKNSVKGKNTKTIVNQSVKKTRIDLQKDHDGYVSKSGRKRKIKSFDNYETDLSCLLRGSKRILQSEDTPTLNTATASACESKKLGNKNEEKGDSCSHFEDGRSKMSVIFLCPLCTEEDKDIGSIQSHIKLKHDQKLLSWEGLGSDKYRKIGDAFPDAASVVHKGKKVCPYCKECCQTTELLKHHVNSCHADHDLYCCGICCLAFASRKAAVMHMKKCHLKPQHVCIDCKEEFRSSRGLMQHNMKIHRKETQDEKDKEIESGISVDHEVNYAVNDITISDKASGEKKTQEYEVDKTVKVISCKNLNTCELLEEKKSLLKERSSGPIVIKSARIIPREEIKEESKESSNETTGNKTDLNKDKSLLISSNIDVADTDYDIEEAEIPSDHENTPNEEHGGETNLSIKPKFRLDFSQINEVKYKCCYEYCGSIFQDYTSWKKHISSHLSNKKKDCMYVPLQCIECGYSSRLKPVFIQHLLVKHSQLGSVEINLEYCQILDQKTLEPVKVMACVFCCLTLDSKHFLTQHKCNRKKVHFYCPFCEKKDASFETLQNHIKEDHSDKTIHRQVLGEKFQSLRTAQHDPAYSVNSTDTTCSTCKKDFETNDDLKVHVNEIHAIGPFSCGVCRQCYGRLCAVKDHMKKTHSLPMICQRCKRRFGDKADLARHEATHLKTKPFKCDLCSAMFSDQRGLSVHYRFKHTEYSVATQLDGNRAKDSATESKPDTFICDICGLILYSHLQYKNHAKNHQVVKQDSVSQINCEICSKTFTSSKTYRRHLCMKAVDGSSPVTVKGRNDSVQSVRDIFEQIKQNPTPGTNSVVKCGLCQKDFNRNKYLFNHIRQVHLPNEGKKFHCSICGSGFTRKAQLQCHMRSHLKTNPYLCRICGKRFRQLGHVKVHLLSHSAQPLFNCKLCTQIFKTKSALNKHISKHCDINPYKCFLTSCDRSFVSLNNLLLHVRNCDNNVMPEKSFECKLCSDMKFEDLKTGLAHMKSHSKDAFYKCSMCSYDFITYRALYEHKAKLKHFTQSEKENAANQTIHTQNFRTKEVRDNVDLTKLQEQYEFTPDSFDSEMYKAVNMEHSEQNEEEENDKVIDSEELMDIAEQLTHMAQRNILNDENLEVKTYRNDDHCVIESVETVIDNYNEELFAASSVQMSVPTSEHNSQYNTLTVFDETNVSNLTSGQQKSPYRNDNSGESSKLNFKDGRALPVQNRNIIGDDDDYQIEVIASHPVINENAVLVSRSSQGKRKLTNDLNTEIVREDDKMPEDCVEVVNGENQPERDTVCIEMLTIPTIYDKFGREVKVNVVNEEGHEIPFQSNQELLQALLTTGNYSLGYNQSDDVKNELTEDTSSVVKGSTETISNLDIVQNTENKTDLGSLSCQNNTEIYVINEVQRIEEEVHLDATKKMFTSRRRAKKQKPNHLRTERNIDNVPGEIIDKDATIGRSKSDNGNVNYKVKLNYYEDRTKNEDIYHLKCDMCPRRFSRLKDLNHHKKIHLPNDEKKFQCIKCGKGYISKNNLISHMLTHSGDRPHKCNQCGKSFRQLGHLQTHLRIHTNYRPFKCTSCEKTFLTNSQLKAHVKTHGVHFKQGFDNCVACLICGNSFASEKHLNIHKIKHISVEAQNQLIKSYNALEQNKEKVGLEKSKSKEHMCDVCGQMFNQLSNLKDHKETHLPASKQTCGECGNEFLTKKRLQVHVKQVHSSLEKWQCDTCGQSFKLKTSFNSHVRHVHKEPKYKCTKCNQDFRRRYVFLKHMPVCIGDEILQKVQ